MATEKNMSFKELIIEAQKGNNEAMTEIIEMYMQVVNKHSYIDGRIDEDDSSKKNAANLLASAIIK